MLRLLMLLHIAAFIASQPAVIPGPDPANGSCLCIDGFQVNVRRSPCGVVIGQATTGYCLKYGGEKTECSLYGDIYTFYKVKFVSSSGWITGGYLRKGVECECEDAGEVINDVISISTLPGCPSISGRTEWGARTPKSVTYINQPFSKVTVQYTETTSCFEKAECGLIMRDIQDKYIDARGDIIYNFGVGDQYGESFVGVGWDRKGASAGNWSSVTFGIGVIGNNTMPPKTENTLNNIQQLISCGVTNGKIMANYTLHAYCDTGCGQCPDNTIIDVIKKWPRYGGILPGGC